MARQETPTAQPSLLPACVCRHVCVRRHAMRAPTHPVPRGRNRTWRWSWSRPFEAMQVKKPASSELTRLITSAPSDCCLCLGNKTRNPLSLCVGQDGTPATRAEAKPRAQLCSNTEQRFSSRSVQPVMQPSGPQIPALVLQTLEKPTARAGFREQKVRGAAGEQPQWLWKFAAGTLISLFAVSLCPGSQTSWGLANLLAVRSLCVNLVEEQISALARL